MGKLLLCVSKGMTLGHSDKPLMKQHKILKEMQKAASAKIISIHLIPTNILSMCGTKLINTMTIGKRKSKN